MTTENRFVICLAIFGAFGGCGKTQNTASQGQNNEAKSKVTVDEKVTVYNLRTQITEGVKPEELAKPFLDVAIATTKGSAAGRVMVVDVANANGSIRQVPILFLTGSSSYAFMIGDDPDAKANRTALTSDYARTRGLDSGSEYLTHDAKGGDPEVMEKLLLAVKNERTVHYGEDNRDARVTELDKSFPFIVVEQDFSKFVTTGGKRQGILTTADVALWRIAPHIWKLDYKINTNPLLYRAIIRWEWVDGQIEPIAQQARKALTEYPDLLKKAQAAGPR